MCVMLCLYVTTVEWCMAVLSGMTRRIPFCFRSLARAIFTVLIKLNLKE